MWPRSFASNHLAQALTPALLGLVAGTALQLQQAALWPLAAYALLLAGGLALGAAALRLQRPWLAFAVVALCAFALCGGRAAQFERGRLAQALEGQTLSVTGVVASLPQRSEAGLRFRLAVEAATLAAAAVQLPPLIDVGWYNQSGFAAGEALPLLDLQRRPGDVQPGERWQFTLRLKAPHGTRNPHGFDFELWQWEQGVQASANVRAGLRDAPPRLLAQTWGYPVEQLRSHVRDAIYAYLLGSSSAPDAEQRRWPGIVAALVLGDQASIDRADWDIFRATGVAHLMSISGLHITLFAWGCALLVGWLWRRSERLCLRLPASSAALLGGLLLATAYALFAGWGLPAQRTVWMLASVALLRLAGQRWPWPQVWLLAMAVVVLGDPWALLQAGFWLSFVAVGVLFATDSGAFGAQYQGVRSRFMQMLREQWVVTLALTPLTLLLFGQVSVVGFAANLLAIPWVTLLVTPLALAGLVVPWFWQVSSWGLQALAAYLDLLNALPWATFSVAKPPLWAGVIGIFGGALLAMRLPLPLRLLGLCWMLPALLWQPLRPEAGEFDLLAADIGQGNALIVRTAEHTLVYDAGPRYSAESDAGHRVLVPLLRALGERVDTLVISHRDADHIGGAKAVLAQQPQAQLLSSIEDGNELQAVKQAERCAAGQQWAWDGVQFEVLHPQLQDYSAGLKPNALSCVLRISNGRHSVLLTGDLEQAQEARLIGQGAPLKVDVLLVPHHGSKTSSSDQFLDAVQPRWAIVQVGYRNRYGHPAAVVMQRYQERGIRVLQSPVCGAVQWRSNAPGQAGCEREQWRRYWQHDLKDSAPG